MKSLAERPENPVVGVAVAHEHGADHATGAALDRRFERAAASQANAARVEYAELHARISSLLALAMHFHDVCLSTTDDFASCVTRLTGRLHRAHDRIDELAGAVDAVMFVEYRDSPPSPAMSTVSLETGYPTNSSYVHPELWMC